MALFQPTNVIPSSFTVGVVDADKDIAQVSWQVNGNSAMTAYQIDFYENDKISTFVKTTGKQIVEGGFYGIDRLGQPTIFTWTCNELDKTLSWWRFGNFRNNKTYKLKITQYWREGDEEKSIEQIEYSVFTARDEPSINIQRCETDDFINPTPFPQGSTLSASIGYFVGEYTQAQGAPVRDVRWRVATWVNGDVGEILADTGDVDTPTLQYTFNGFFIGNQYAVRCSGKADYQTYGSQDFDSGWVNFTVEIEERQNKYDGIFSVTCLPKENATLLEWESMQVISPSITPDGYVPKISNGEVSLSPDYNGKTYTVTWDNKDEQPIDFSQPWTMAWKGKSAYLPYAGEIDDANKFLGAASIIRFNPQGTVLVASGEDSERNEVVCVYSVEKSTTPFDKKSTLTFEKKLTTAERYSFANISTMSFSPDGKLLVIGGLNTTGLIGCSYVFSVNESDITFVAPIYKNSAMYKASASAFSPDGKTLILGGKNSVAIFSVNGTQITYLRELKLNQGDFVGNVTAIAFSPDGKKLVVGGTFTGGATYYSVNGDDITYVSNIKRSDGEISEVSDIAFSPNGELLTLVGNLDGTTHITAEVFSVKDDGISYLYNIYAPSANEGGLSVTFSHDGSLLLVGTVNFIMPTVHVYSVDGTQTTYIKTMTPIDNKSNFSYHAAFSADDSLLLCGGAIFNNYIGDLLQLQCVDDYNVLISATKSAITIVQRHEKTEMIIARFDVDITAQEALILLTPSDAYLFTETDGWLSKSVKYGQASITSVSIYGGGGGSSVDSVSVYMGDGANVLPLYQNNTSFEPLWDVAGYNLYMSANFNNSLEGGTGTGAPSNGFRIYRQEVNSNILTPIATIYSHETQLKDFGIRSRKAYKYSLYVYDSNDAFIQGTTNETVVVTSFKNYSLLVCDYDSENDAYHVRKQYIFALNLSEGSIGNNNSPTINKNFTAYPTRMPDTANYTSGTLQGLIGAIYTVPALVEQLGGIKHISHPSTLDYFDSVDLEKELYDLSIAPYQLFLRDMKGHLRMVATNGAISMTQDLKKRQLSTSISLSWVEIGDASDVTIIQTPSDYGWNNDSQVLDVNLDVDPSTGVLSANYPKPYDGTKFYLTGVNKEILGAETPNGVTPAQFELSKTATEPEDGVLTATVKVNREEN